MTAATKPRRPLRCKRCGHRWFPRSSRRPGQCPNPHCHSTLWDRRSMAAEVRSSGPTNPDAPDVEDTP